MEELEKITRYTERTNAPADRWSLRLSELLAIASMPSVLEAVVLAYNYGKAKGYQAGKKTITRRFCVA